VRVPIRLGSAIAVAAASLTEAGAVTVPGAVGGEGTVAF
jgi:hypothetical protein